MGCGGGGVFGGGGGGGGGFLRGRWGEEQGEGEEVAG